jgi:hypothetical protein
MLHASAGARPPRRRISAAALPVRESSVVRALTGLGVTTKDAVCSSREQKTGKKPCKDDHGPSSLGSAPALPEPSIAEKGEKSMAATVPAEVLDNDAGHTRAQALAAQPCAIGHNSRGSVLLQEEPSVFAATIPPGATTTAPAMEHPTLPASPTPTQNPMAALSEPMAAVTNRLIPKEYAVRP